MITVKQAGEYKDYGKVLSISNGTVQALVTTDLGPRIIFYGFIGGQNFMNDNRSFFGTKTDKEFEDYFGKGTFWENLGGHRVWISPESYPETYNPDNYPVEYEITETGAVFKPRPETANGVYKELEIAMSESGTDMKVIMRVTNISDKDKDFAIWGLSVSATGGTAIIPMNTNDTGLLSNRIISVWPYTDLSDERIYYGKKYITLRQDPERVPPIKLGFDLNCGKIHYVLGNEVFTKSYETLHPTAKYPDGGCSFETYNCDGFIELESLGELKTVKPNETSVLVENWKITEKPCDVDTRNDDSIDCFCGKL
ncbi:MAG: hypothetical protein MJ090_05390 [Clostridia bacterium]|nr:hypothetical protein [Clostridia bacterium]